MEGDRYPMKITDDLMNAMRRAYTGKNYAVKDDVRQCIRWLNHDLFTEPPGGDGEYHLVFLRNNLLTYYQGHAIPDVSTQHPGFHGHRRTAFWYFLYKKADWQHLHSRWP